MLIQNELDVLLERQTAAPTGAPKTPNGCEDMFNILLATNAMIYALDRGETQIAQIADVIHSRTELEHLHQNLAEA